MTPMGHSTSTCLKCKGEVLLKNVAIWYVCTHLLTSVSKRCGDKPTWELGVVCSTQYSLRAMTEWTWTDMSVVNHMVKWTDNRLEIFLFPIFPLPLLAWPAKKQKKNHHIGTTKGFRYSLTILLITIIRDCAVKGRAEKGEGCKPGCWAQEERGAKSRSNCPQCRG